MVGPEGGGEVDQGKRGNYSAKGQRLCPPEIEIFVEICYCDRGHVSCIFVSPMGLDCVPIDIFVQVSHLNKFLHSWFNSPSVAL